MANPLGGIATGRREVMGVYERIFSGRAIVRVEFHDFATHVHGGTLLAIGRERGSIKVDGSSLDLRIRTSRMFQLVDHHWRQFHHHGSIDEPDLLAEYQGAVSSGAASSSSVEGIS